MNEEIKEILDYLKKENKNNLGFNQDKLLSYEESKLLLDYITNLQQCYCNRTDCSGRIKDSKQYDSLLQKYESLQKENERLKQRNNFLNSVCVGFDDKYEDYKSRCEKAVEYINEHIKYECDNVINGMQFCSYHLYNFEKDDLLNILQGSKED